MGYAIICHLDHSSIDDDTDLTATLRDVAGTSSYPTSWPEPRHAGPWTAVAAVHSTQHTLLRCDTHTITTAAWDGNSDGQLGWDRTITVGEHAGAIREMLRHPHQQREQVAVAAATRNLENYGASIWWLYADSVDTLRGLPERTLDTLIRNAAVADIDGSVPIGSYMNALNCAGRLYRAGEADLEWAGNRIATP